MGRSLHVWGTVFGLPAELGACLGIGPWLLGTGGVGLLARGRLRGQGEMPEPQYASQAGPPLIFSIDGSAHICIVVWTETA